MKNNQSGSKIRSPMKTLVNEKIHLIKRHLLCSLVNSNWVVT